MKKLTDIFCGKAKAQNSKMTGEPARAEYLDPTGLRLVVQTSGKKSWAVRARLNGEQIKVTLGRYPAVPLAEARQRALAVLARVEQGEDPRVERAKAKANTVKTVFDRWMRDEQRHNRGHREVERLFEARILPKFGQRPVVTVTSEEVATFLDDIAEEVSDTRSRHVRAHLRRFFQFAVEKFIIQFNPAAAVKPRGKNKARDRYLTDDEVVLVWRAAEKMGFPFGPYYQLALLTGARRAEVLNLRWDEIDMKQKQIRLEGERTKNGQPHIIPLSATALDILKSLPRFNGSDYVLTTNGVNPCSGDSKAKDRIDGLITELNDETPLPDWRVHDFRRTVAVNLQRTGYTLPVIESILGHSSGSRAGIVGVYQVYDFMGERKKALAEWAEHLGNLLAEEKKAVSA